MQLVRQVQFKSSKLLDKITFLACKDCGMVLNADVNASINILQKEIPKSQWIGDRGCLNRPLELKIC